MRPAGRTRDRAGTPTAGASAAGAGGPWDEGREEVMDERDTAAALVAMQRQVATGDWALSRHARQELDAEVITPTEVREAIATGSILEH